MQTDQLFQEYFQVAPGAFFELLQIDLPCAYRFTSPVFKTSERRMDGFLAPLEVGKPYYFIEFQGYRDKHIYWRALYPVVRHHELAADLKQQAWKCVVLFLDDSHDPGIETHGFAILSDILYNSYMANENTTIRVWVKTLRNLRLIYALTGESMASILDRIVLQELKRVQQVQSTDDQKSL